ncbi:MAG: cation:proton antiporter, partial [Rhodococcus sp. (in: high G+C Gram-positive bacteria)]
RLVGEQIGYGAAAGVGAGAVAAAILVFASRLKTIEPLWAQIVPVAAAALAYTIAVPIGGSGFIAAFVGGLAFGAIRKRVGGEISHLIEELGDLFNAITFIVFGAVLLSLALGHLTWQIVLYSVLSLTVVRMVPVTLSLFGLHARTPTIAFIGWFGPRGLATIVFAILILEEHNDLPNQELILTTAATTIALSILAHGITAPPLAERYSAWLHHHPHSGNRPVEHQ